MATKAENTTTQLRRESTVCNAAAVDVVFDSVTT
jgi:hypothetical protein